MTIESGFFNSVNGDRKYNSDFFKKFFSSLIGNGIFVQSSTNLQVVEATNMNVVVKPGKGWINGYFVISDSEYTITLDNADGVLNRIDRIVLRLNYADRQITIENKKGAFATTPVAPTLQRDAEIFELALADIRITNGATSITQTNITDTRFNTNLCGVVKGLIDEIDTTNLFAQYDTRFYEWFDSVREYLNDTAAGNVASALADHVLDMSAHGLGTATLQTQAKTVREAINEVFQTGNNVKSGVVDTLLSLDSTLPISNNSTWGDITNTLPNISGKAPMNVFIQPTQPATKDGIWFQTDESNKPDIEDYKVAPSLINGTTRSTMATPPFSVRDVTDIHSHVELGKIFFCGITNNLDGSVKTHNIYAYNVNNDTYSVMTNFTAYAVYGTILIEDNFYVFIKETSTSSSSIVTYNIKTGAKTAKNPTGDVFFNGSPLGFYNNRIYNPYYGANVFRLTVYDISANISTTLNLSTPWGSTTPMNHCFFGSKIYILLSNRTIYAYDFILETYSVINNNTTFSSLISANMISDGMDIYLLGGRDNNNNFLNSVYKYEAIENKWIVISTINTTSIARVCRFENKLYSLGSYAKDGTYTPDFFRINLLNNIIKGVNIDTDSSTQNSNVTALLTVRSYTTLKRLTQNFRVAYISKDGKDILRNIPTYIGNGTSWVRATNIK